ncbi:hypothetical protein C0033_16385 [Clostridium sp. chh4-2]|nr:hypothetical protein C0033_16385 [Clostridium sp. chh4-2]
MVITIVDEVDDVVAARLMAIPALLQQMWIRLVEEELYLVGDDWVKADVSCTAGSRMWYVYLLHKNERGGY